MVSSLWQEGQAEVWQKQPKEVESRVEVLDKAGLVEVDRWWAQTLPSVLQARGEAYLTKEEVVKLVEWKLTRGKWRPNLLKYAKDASEEAVVAATKKAFACLGTAASPDMAHVEEALKELTTLKGVGPATASAMLAAVNTSLPFMSDEAMAAALPGRPEYTVKKYLPLVEALRRKAEALSNADADWTAAQVERALWSEALAKQLLTQASKGTKRKR